nr:hypothetical protein B0A51_03345 [Rachicladosporium sp. CCFEE 5018]
MQFLELALLSLPLQVTAQITAAAQLLPRQNDPAFVGYISGPSGYESRNCDYPETLATSDLYVQCCKPNAPCNFYENCAGNTLYGGISGASVPCDVSPELTCNTAVLVPTTLAQYLPQAYSYLACWQTTLGTGPFTIVQSVPSGHIVPLTASSSPLTEALSTGAAATTSTPATSASSTAASASLSTPTGALGEPIASPTLVTPSSGATVMSGSNAGASASSATAATATGASTASSASAAAASSASAAAASGKCSGVGSGVFAWLLTVVLSLL